ncbi:MAG TPA: asparagine synthase (glutamine-hydrolyzing) [Planctomycetota bacterium]|nr:asparagine synthase (glutamine-hydrolyzing) [Planctomycetota bacterium]HRR78819.1 asparagine synthase (glutamine-hydrolyzing) [Planctomycetota bacterium]HRT92874.1 asparagine synthase (glutamine-hydrolyzing) [Planctomycetota bacterium]
MCGIAGLIWCSGEAPPVELLLRMADAQRHRGPDGEGFALLSLDPHGSRGFSRNAPPPAVPRPVGGFAFRRLAILDLTDAAAQPMSNDDGSVWLVFNGEVYNYVELRAELEARGCRFRSTGDTEVVLRAYEAWGVDCFARFNGMWGIGLWDARQGALILCRDRFGVKPLHYHFDGTRLVFASEIKALLEAPWVRREPDDTAIADYLVHRRVNCTEHTFFRGIWSLPAGHFLRLELPSPVPQLRLAKWWDIREHLKEPPHSEAACFEEFRRLFRDAVRVRLRSDVPVGTALSGGLDSSSVVCTARPFLRAGNQKAFSACYEGFELDEKRYIDLVVEHTGVESHVTRPTAESLLSDLERFVWHQEEPVRTTSMYAQFKVFELARREGTPVTLDGQGADETLAGYPYFFPVHFAGLLASGRLVAWWHEAAAYARNHRRSLPYAWLSTLAGFASHRRMIRLANRFSHEDKASWVSPPLRHLAAGIAAERPSVFGGRLNQRLYEVFAWDGLPALLRYEDRNSMAHSVESRLPFMDWRLVVFLFSLPASFKIRDGTTKWILRQAMAGTVPAAILARHDKIGFATPERAWIRSASAGPLADLVERAIARDFGWWDPRRLSRLWRRFREGQASSAGSIWRVANLMLWRERFLACFNGGGG